MLFLEIYLSLDFLIPLTIGSPFSKLILSTWWLVNSCVYLINGFIEVLHTYSKVSESWVHKLMAFYKVNKFIKLSISENNPWLLTKEGLLASFSKYWSKRNYYPDFYHHRLVLPIFWTLYSGIMQCSLCCLAFLISFMFVKFVYIGTWGNISFIFFAFYCSVVSCMSQFIYPPVNKEEQRGWLTTQFCKD